MRSFLVAGLAAAALAVAVVVARSEADAPSLVRQLADARPQRTFPARLSIPTRYRPCDTAAATDSTLPREDCGRPGRRPRNLLAFQDAGQSFAPDSLHGSALASMIWRAKEEGELDDAIDRLERASRLTLDCVPLLVDLSAAYLLRFDLAGEPRDLVAALDRALEARDDEPRNLEAHFNAALAMQALFLDGEARRAWDAYLAIDSTTDWADEAKARKSQLITEYKPLQKPTPNASKEVIERFAREQPQEARMLGMDSVLGEWGAAVEAGDSALANLYLEFAGRLGAALTQRPGGDRSLADAVDSIRAARTSATARAKLAQAHQLYASGRQHFQVRNDSARLAFSRVLELRPPSRALRQWAAIERAAALVLSRERDAAGVAANELLPHVDSIRHPALAARVRWIYATTLIRGSEEKDSGKEYRVSASLFERAGEIDNMGLVIAYGTESLHRQGDTLAAYRYLHHVMGLARTKRHSLLMHNQVFLLSLFAGLDGMSRASSTILDEDVSIAARLDSPVNTVEALIARAGARAVVGDSAGAASDLDLADKYAPQIQDSTAARFATILRFSRSAVAGKTSSSTLAEMDAAIDYFAKDNENVLWLFPALTRRASARIATNNLVGAIEDLDSVTAYIDGLSNKQKEARLRGAMIDQARGWFDQLVMLYARADDPVNALRVLERGRLSFTSRPMGRAPDADLQLATLPPGQVALEYALIGDTLVTWVVDTDSIRMLKRHVDRNAFQLTVERTTAALKSVDRADAANLDLRHLYAWLITPARRYLGPQDSTLVIVADGEVAAVPFDALLDEDGKWLVEHYTLRHAVTLADAARPAAPDSMARALLVADPDFEDLDFPELEQLSGARIEVDSLMSVYRNHVVLQDSAATRQAFLRAAPSARIIHYAGHAVFDDARPERSYLVLAGADSVSRLTAQELGALPLRGVRLVVLSACQTLRARGGRTGGFAGLSSALLEAGVGGMVGSLWPVHDKLTQPLMLHFHERYRHHGDPARALREAQLWMLRESADSALASPAAWAGFRYAGN